MFGLLAELLCCLTATAARAIVQNEERQHLLSIQTVPFEIMYHTGTAKDSYITLLAFARRYKRHPRPNETYHKVNLGKWVTNLKKLQSTNKLSIHDIRALGYIEMYRPDDPFYNLVASCPRIVAEVTTDAEISARFILLWCFVKQFNRFPNLNESYRNFTIGNWWIGITKDTSLPSSYIVAVKAIVEGVKCS
jgi:hypothetical protein